MHKYSVRISDPAVDDLSDLSGFYLDLVDEESAIKFEQDAEETIESLETFPEGNAYYDEEHNLRRVNLRKHKVAVIYTVDNNIYEVMAVLAFHSMRDPRVIRKLVEDRL